jgi:hypothetical protein
VVTARRLKSLRKNSPILLYRRSSRRFLVGRDVRRVIPA